MPIHHHLSVIVSFPAVHTSTYILQAPRPTHFLSPSVDPHIVCCPKPSPDSWFNLYPGLAPYVTRCIHVQFSWFSCNSSLSPDPSHFPYIYHHLPEVVSLPALLTGTYFKQHDPLISCPHQWTPTHRLQTIPRLRIRSAPYKVRCIYAQFNWLQSKVRKGCAYSKVLLQSFFVPASKQAMHVLKFPRQAAATPQRRNTAQSRQDNPPCSFHTMQIAKTPSW